MLKKRKRTSAQKAASRYRIFMPYCGSEKEVGQAQWQRHLKIGNLTRHSNDEEIQKRLNENPRLACVKPGLYTYDNEITGVLEFAPLQGREALPAAPHNSHQVGWQNWLYRPPFSYPLTAQEGHLPRYSGQSTKDPNNRIEVW